MDVVADNPEEKIDLKIFHSEIQNDHAAIAREEAGYKPIPKIACVTTEDIRENYLKIKDEVRQLIAEELERVEMENSTRTPYSKSSTGKDTQANKQIPPTMSL